jgi:branched-chain amino acid transport system permease protein
MIVQQIFSGLLSGAIYALFAVGFAMIFGVMRVLNMAHADFGIVTAFAVIGLASTGLGIVSAIVIALVATIALALVVERVAMRPGRRFRGDASVEMPLIATLGASMIIESGAAIMLGNRAQVFPIQLRDFIWINGFFFSQGLLISAVVAVILLIALEILVNRTDFGRQIRAVAMNPDAARIMGINPNTVIMVTVGITGLLAGVAGILVGITYGLVGPFTGVAYAIKGLVAMIAGGIGSLRGAALGAALIGVTEAVAATYFGTQARDVSVFVVLVVILTLKPSGLISAQQSR